MGTSSERALAATGVATGGLSDGSFGHRFLILIELKRRGKLELC